MTRKFCYLLVLSLLFPFTVSAAIPQTINYQGFLTDNAGTPINGTVTIVFSLYDAPTGGTRLWTDSNSVNAVNGLVNHNLGPINLAFDSQIYIGIAVGSDPEMSPRQALTSVPYAYHAKTVEQDTLTQLSCTTNQVAKWNGTAWACADDNTGSGGVTSVTAGGGLNGSGTTGDITLSIPNSGVTSAMAGFNYAGSPSKGGAANSAADLVCSSCVSGAEIATGQVVKSVNGSTDAVTFSAGSNVTITPGLPGQFTVAATDSDTLAGLSCSTDQIAKYNGSAWGCGTASAGAEIKALNATNYTSTTLAENDIVYIEENINISANYTGLNTRSIHVTGGGFIGTGTQSIDFNRYSKVSGVYFKDVEIDINPPVTFINCRFEGAISFSTSKANIIGSEFTSGTMNLNNLYISSSKISGVTDTSGTIDVLVGSEIVGSTFRVNQLSNNYVETSEVSRLISATGNQFFESLVLFGAETSFSGNSCGDTTLELLDSSSSISITGNSFKDPYPGKDQSVLIQATSNLYRSITVSGNSFNTANMLRSIMVTGSPSGSSQLVSITNNTFISGTQAVGYLGNLPTVVQNNVLRNVSSGIGVSTTGSYLTVQNNTTMP